MTDEKYDEEIENKLSVFVAEYRLIEEIIR